VYALEEFMVTEKDIYSTGRLTARWANFTPTEQKSGVHPLKLDNKRESFVYLPKGYNPQHPSSLVVLLHGAGGQAGHGLSILRSFADEKNLILLAPSSRAGTWDIIASQTFGTDVLYIDQALRFCFEHYAVETSRVAIGGFSDGASYALCLGLTNGDLFTHVLAFSPGFCYRIAQAGTPGIFISHGIKDRILPIDACSRKIVSDLQQQNVKVNYKEFEGGHEIPARISKSAVDWFLKPNNSAEKK
jgi:predicted esterase